MALKLHDLQKVQNTKQGARKHKRQVGAAKVQLYVRKEQEAIPRKNVRLEEDDLSEKIHPKFTDTKSFSPIISLCFTNFAYQHI